MREDKFEREQDKNPLTKTGRQVYEGRGGPRKKAKGKLT